MQYQNEDDGAIGRDDFVIVRFAVKRLKLALAARALGSHSDSGGWCYHDARVAQLNAQARDMFSLLQAAVAPTHCHQPSLMSKIRDELPGTISRFEEALAVTTAAGSPRHSRLFRKELKVAIDALRVLANLI